MTRFQQLHRKVGRLTPDEADEYEELSRLEDRKGGWLGFGLVILLSAIAASCVLSSCVLTLHPDGTASVRPDPETIFKGIETITESSK